MKNYSAQEIVKHLDLQPHPEGGWYKETYRHQPSDGSRGDQTAIFFLLEKGQGSHWHKVDAVEMWHWYAGSPLTLRSHNGKFHNEEKQTVVTLGPDVIAGQTPQHVIPKDHWQAASAEQGWVLVGCTVAPAFEFDGFELAAPGWAPGK
ncbi:cupin domain-containing protein [Kiloniella sp. EL199]|uniref:cupin domain-containing protein n=1 Tax=Kiloniella sp. EL199 TaxID=2107581 RepID=UPI000E9FFED4|nr:cupin domain-containing protein [Kiloniella sp. EL199]